MSADILNQILGGDEPVAKQPKPRALDPEAVSKTRTVLDGYDLGQALDALSQHHHARAVKLVEQMIALLDEATKSPRRSTLDGTLDAMAEWINDTKAERKQSRMFESVAMMVGKGHPTAQLFEMIQSAAAKPSK